MTNSPSFWDHPLETLEEALDLRKRIEVLQSQLSNIIGNITAPVMTKIGGGKPGMSAAGRARIAAAQKARWAKVKKTTATPASKARKTMSPAARAKIAAAQRARWAKSRQTSGEIPAPSMKAQMKKAPKKKGGLTPEGRAKLAAAMKARWAARKKGVAAPNASA